MPAPTPETVLHDDLLGLLRWNPALDWWEGGFLLSGFLPVGLSLSPPEEEVTTGAIATAPLLAAARALVTRLQDEDSERALRLAVADTLLPLRATPEWQPPDSLLPLPDRDTFAERLLLEDSIVYADNTVELFYDDGGNFEGHTLLVTLDETGALTAATLGG